MTDTPAVIDKPRVRVRAGTTYTADSFANANQRLGLGMGGALDGSGYTFTMLTRNRVALEAAYRTSWIVRQAVDAPAEDMTRGGITLETSLNPEDEKRIYDAYRDLQIGQKLAEGIGWGRLYGGAINLLMIDGQDVEKPLRLNTIKEGQFKGLMPLDRWVAQPDMTRIVEDFGPDVGLPEFYNVQANPQFGVKAMRIHHSRVIRHEGAKLPLLQRQTEQLWGSSNLEAMWDRLLAFDSTTMGVAQLVFKAHLRTLTIEGYRDVLAAGGKMFEVIMQQIEHIRMFQNQEGLTVLDAKDNFETHTYQFGGLDDVLSSIGDQVCGALEIPRVRLFGEAPGGLNTDGDSALKTYYDQIMKKQETNLRRPTTRVLDVLTRSVMGDLPKSFSFAFNPLWQMSAKDQAEIAKSTTDSVTTAFEKGVITQKVAMQELKASARITGVYSNITQADIDAAEDVIPDPVETARDMAEATAIADPESEGGEGAKSKEKVAA